MKEFTLQGNIVDIFHQSIFGGTIQVKNGIIQSIIADQKWYPQFILPGLIDAHVHVESSLLVPSEFARMAVVHGTVATVSDPHEIANVLGLEGVEFMLNNGAQVPFHFYFGAPSCVPATSFETAGARLDLPAVDLLLQCPQIKYLSEMMNFPGVLQEDPQVMGKIAAAKKYGKPIDGHAPGLMGEEAKKYACAGISTDHECFSEQEAKDKLQLGMKILIREGSAARNFDALIGLLEEYPDQIMFCSDDKHPDSLVLGHINELVKRALRRGISLFPVLRAACINPVLHYRLPVGLLRKKDPADFIVVSDLTEFKLLQTYIDGQLVAEQGKTRISSVPVDPINHFQCTSKTPEDFRILLPDSFSASGTPPLIRVMEARDGQLITTSSLVAALVKKESGHLGRSWVEPDPDRDILKLVVVNRYQEAPVARAFIRNFQLKKGAMASSVAHDSHNLIAVGVDDESLCQAVNAVIHHRGGLSVWNGRESLVLPLPVAGLMSPEDGWKVAEKYSLLDRHAKALGSTLTSPFMTLSFMALLVIPQLKLSDLGLFDGETFQFTPLMVENDFGH
ncbi:MAG: adenine deaminase [Chitinophagaceae bacterium]